MDYEKFLTEVQELEFIPDQELADATVKAALGILASRVPEEQARKMADKLPGPLTLERLRGMQQNVANVSFEQFVNDLMLQFKMDRDQTNLLISRVLRLARETMGEETFGNLKQHLPVDWVEGLEKATSAAARA